MYSSHHTSAFSCVIRHPVRGSYANTSGSICYATFRARESLVLAGYADTPIGLRMMQVYAALAHVAMCTLRRPRRGAWTGVVRLCVTHVGYARTTLCFTKVSYGLAEKPNTQGTCTSAGVCTSIYLTLRRFFGIRILRLQLYEVPCERMVI
jgi:hypothetical protein